MCVCMSKYTYVCVCVCIHMYSWHCMTYIPKAFYSTRVSHGNPLETRVFFLCSSSVCFLATFINEETFSCNSEAKASELQVNLEMSRMTKS